MIPMEQEELALMMEAGYVFLGMQRYKEAKEVFEGLTVLKPDSEIPLVALAGVFFCQGQLKDAIRIYKKALQLVPGSLYATAYLGESLFFSGEKTEAVKLLKAADRQDSKGPVGDFARALLNAIDKGFTPQILSQEKEVREYYEKKKRNH